MKKLFQKNRKLKINFKNNHLTCFLLKSILKNCFIFNLLKFNAYLKLKHLVMLQSTANKCVVSYNKKRYNKMSYYCRSIFLKKIQNGEIFGISKINW